MAARINEKTQFVDIAGNPLVNGNLYIGTVGLDPVANAITIYSDRELTVALANPQLLDAQGRSTNKIWIPGRYSMQVNDVLAVQQVQDLDAGEDSSAGLSTLTNIQGADTITAEGVPAITAYIDKQQYTFIAAADNTGAVTINIDAQGAKTIKRNFDLDIFKGQFKQNQFVIVAYNSTQDIMEWVNHNNKVAYDNQGAGIASAATVDLSLATGNLIQITGNTGPITSFGTTPAGTQFHLQFTGTPGITHSANIQLPGDADITMAIGDEMILNSAGSGIYIAQVFRATGKALVETNSTKNNMEVFTADGTWTQVDGVTEVMVVAIGGAGGGGGNNGASEEGGGGGGGAYIKALVTVAGNVTITIGPGGAGGGSGTGAAGTDTTFGSAVTAQAGSGGAGAAPGVNAGGLGGDYATTTTTGTLIEKRSGTDGDDGIDTDNAGDGGQNGLVGGTVPNGASSSNTPGTIGIGLGSGGGGANGIQAGGAGTDGYIIVWW